MAACKKITLSFLLTLLVLSLLHKEINAAACDGQSQESCKETAAPNGQSPPEKKETGAGDGTTNDEGDISKDFGGDDEFDAEIFVLGH